MENVVLVIHLLLALAIIGLVLLQRSEGGGLGIGGGGGMGGLTTAKGAANALTRATTIFATLFFITSLTLVVLSGQKTKSNVLDSALSGDIAPAAIEAPVEGGDVESEVEAPVAPLAE